MGFKIVSNGEGHTVELAKHAAQQRFLKNNRQLVRAHLHNNDHRDIAMFTSVVYNMSRMGEYTHFGGKEHACRLVSLGDPFAVSAFAPPYLERGNVRSQQFYHWVLFADARQIIALPFKECVESISAALKTNAVKIFYDTFTKSRALPRVSQPIVDVKHLFNETFSNEYDGEVTLERMIERYHSGHETQLIGPPEKEQFYAGFYTDDLHALTNEHKRAMACQVVGIYFIYQRLISN